MKKYTRFNFFKHTFCDWVEIPLDFIKDREPNYKSKAGSQYFFDDEGVARLSNHWGRAANCRWRITGDNKVNNQGLVLAYAKWTDFFPNNEDEKLYVIIVKVKQKSVTFTHKESLKSSGMIVRTAKETAKRISKIKEVLETDHWFKYIEGVDLEVARELIVEQLVSTEKDFQFIKRSLFNR
ncbi:hypothetical protein NWE55_15720 [Myroides albus]|uniref:hypothetical protein n=1 Tax=Myroides albus TaxID=2562892 RepID=UPI002159538D|nr:hypothetical protein [Myroides albus]UVD79551.1 hypothetical protein NWE55_15720 [Myroides albus]